MDSISSITLIVVAHDCAFLCSLHSVSILVSVTGTHMRSVHGLPPFHLEVTLATATLIVLAGFLVLWHHRHDGLSLVAQIMTQHILVPLNSSPGGHPSQPSNLTSLLFLYDI
jgi:hypothetical protein